MPHPARAARLALLLASLGLATACGQAASVAGPAAGAAAQQAAGPAGQAAGAAAQAAVTPAARELAILTAAAARGAWDLVAEATLPACTGDADKACAEAHALRARACRRMAASAPPERRAGYRDCAVASGQAALAAAGANTQAERNAWREELLAALFDRRAVTPRANICPDNDLMRAEADRLLQDAPGNSAARFYAASARMLGVSVACGAEEQRCADLAEAARLLTPPRTGDARWVETLEGVRRLQRVVVGCPEA
jgi:hypothetical protein